jgi:hypothetical protein
MSLLTELEDVTGVGVCYKHVAPDGAGEARVTEASAGSPLRAFGVFRTPLHLPYGFSNRKYLLALAAFTLTR